MTHTPDELKALDAERQLRLRWLARLLGEPVEQVTLSETTEPVVPKPDRCGIGRGSECCIFLTAGADGFACARHGPWDGELRQRRATMNAQRMPDDSYPSCMAFQAKTEKQT